MSLKLSLKGLTLLLIAVAVRSTSAAEGPRAYVRVSQVGYESGAGIHRAYLMSSVAETNASFRVLNADKQSVYEGSIGPPLGTWGHKAGLTYDIYALDFELRFCRACIIEVSGTVPTQSSWFAIDSASRLYDGLLLNSRFFYETQRDGPQYIENTFRSAPGHLHDQSAKAYWTPSLDEDNNINTQAKPLKPTGAVLDASGGWWDAGDYMKYVETISYTVALQEIGIRDFPNQIGPGATFHPTAPPLALSFSGDAAGSPQSADLSAEATFGLHFLLHMWDEKTKTLYYQVGNSQDWTNFDLLSDYDVWRLPQDDDHLNGCDGSAFFLCQRPVFQAGPAGSPISPNLAGRLAAAFALGYQLNREADPALAWRYLKAAVSIFDLADTSIPDPAAAVDSGSCKAHCLLTIIPFDGYPETVWSDDMELGAAELYLALRQACLHHESLDSLRSEVSPEFYLKQAARHARRYIGQVYASGGSDVLNLYDVSGLAHFELARALQTAGNPQSLEVTEASISSQLVKQVQDALDAGKEDAWGFGASWRDDTASHGNGLSVMASEAFYLTGRTEFDILAQRSMANVLGANPWGASFIVGAGSRTFPNCIQHQVANIVGSLDGRSKGLPILWGAVVEGPASESTSGLLDGMRACPADGVDIFGKFNGNDGVYSSDAAAVFQDNVESYSTTEPAIDLTASSFLMWSWRIAKAPAHLP